MTSIWTKSATPRLSPQSPKIGLHRANQASNLTTSEAVQKLPLNEQLDIQTQPSSDTNQSLYFHPPEYNQPTSAENQEGNVTANTVEIPTSAKNTVETKHRKIEKMATPEWNEFVQLQDITEFKTPEDLDDAFLRFITAKNMIIHDEKIQSIINNYFTPNNSIDSLDNLEAELYAEINKVSKEETQEYKDMAKYITKILKKNIDVAKPIINEDVNLQKIIYRHFISCNNSCDSQSFEILGKTLDTYLKENSNESSLAIRNAIIHIVQANSNEYTCPFEIKAGEPGKHKGDIVINNAPIGLVYCLAPNELPEFNKEFSQQESLRNNFINTKNDIALNSINFLYRIDDITNDSRIPDTLKIKLKLFVEAKYVNNKTQVYYYLNQNENGIKYVKLSELAANAINLTTTQRVRIATGIIEGAFALATNLLKKAGIAHLDFHCNNILAVPPSNYENNDDPIKIEMKVIDLGKIHTFAPQSDEIAVIKDKVKDFFEYITGGDVLKYGQQTFTLEDKKKCIRMIIAYAFSIVMNSYEKGFKMFDSVTFKYELWKIKKKLKDATTIDEINAIPNEFRNLCIETINSLAEEKKASYGGGATATPEKTFGGMPKTPIRQAHPYGAYATSTPTKKNEQPQSNTNAIETPASENATNNEQLQSNTTAIEIPVSENATDSVNLLGYSSSLPENMISNDITDNPTPSETRNSCPPNLATDSVNLLGYSSSLPENMISNDITDNPTPSETRSSCPPNLINSSEIEPQESQTSDQQSQNSHAHEQIQEQPVNNIMETDHSTQRIGDIDEINDKQKQRPLTETNPYDINDMSIFPKPRSTTNPTRNAQQSRSIFSDLTEFKVRQSSQILRNFFSAQPNEQALSGGGTQNIPLSGAKADDHTTTTSTTTTTTQRLSATEK